MKKFYAKFIIDKMAVGVQISIATAFFHLNSSNTDMLKTTCSLT